MQHLARATLVAVLSFMLVACGGGGGFTPALGTTQRSIAPEANASAPVAGEDESLPANNGAELVSPAKSRTFFAAAPNVRAILAFDEDGTPSAGPLAPARVIEGIPLLSPSMAYDSANDRLFVSSGWGDLNEPLGLGTEILVFDQASKANGNATPIKRISLPALSGPFQLQWDETHERLYVGSFQQSLYSDVLVTIEGAASPTAAINTYRSPSGSRGMVIDTQRQVVYGLGSTVGVHPFNLGYLTDPSLPGSPWTNWIPMPKPYPLGGLALDTSRDRLYVVDGTNMAPFTTGILVIESASTAYPRPFKVDTTSITSESPRYVSFDETNDRLYVGYVGRAVMIEHASSLAGDSRPVASTILTTGERDTYLGGFVFP